VHTAVGPGLLESVYEECLCHELKLRGIGYDRQVVVPLRYKSLELAAAYRLDIIVERRGIRRLSKKQPKNLRVSSETPHLP
jgi:GxxExxY protein